MSVVLGSVVLNVINVIDEVHHEGMSTVRCEHNQRAVRFEVWEHTAH